MEYSGIFNRRSSLLSDSYYATHLNSTQLNSIQLTERNERWKRAPRKLTGDWQEDAPASPGLCRATACRRKSFETPRSQRAFFAKRTSGLPRRCGSMTRRRRSSAFPLTFEHAFGSCSRTLYGRLQRLRSEKSTGRSR